MSAVPYVAEQTGKREWHARVWWAGRWHGIGYRDNPHEAMQAASRVYWSTRGHWDGLPPPAAQQTEGMVKAASGGRENKGLSPDKMRTRYPSLGLLRVRAKAAAGAGFVCEHCGAEMFRARGRFCSDRCRKAAARLERVA